MSLKRDNCAMVTGRSRKSRGLTAGAAFVFAVILTGTAMMVQSTSPITISPASLSAASQAAAGGVLAQSGEIIQINTNMDGSPAQQSSSQSSQTSASRTPEKAGMDIVAFLYSSASKPQRERYFPVCPDVPNAIQTSEQKVFADNVKKQLENQGGSFGIVDSTRCQLSADGKRFVPKTNTKWQQWTLFCQPRNPSASGASAKKDESKIITTQEMDEALDNVIDFAENKNSSVFVCKAVPPGSDAATPPGPASSGKIQSVADQLKDAQTLQQRNEILTANGITDRDMPELERALSQNQTELKTGIIEIDRRQTDVQKQLNDMVQADPNLSQQCTTGNSSANCTAYKDLVDQKQSLTALRKQQEAQLNNLAAAKGSLDPYANGSGRETPDYRPGGGGYNQDIAGGVNNGGSQFRNPSLGANNTQPSPFGGACVTGYVCSGNTLYWQSAGGYGGGQYGYGQGSCMTQPYQQCQYGCQAPYGMQQQTGQQQGTLGSIMKYVPIITAVAGLFGGGSNNSTANQNLSRSCAMSPQMQAPYGSGTNGQSCPQPPQEPNPSQCTSGSWRPVSAQQNGCVTGYQCVRDGSNGNGNGNGTGGGSGSGGVGTSPPTAQLSCQPQMTDVGATISISYSCGNANASTGTGFSTDGKLSGSTNVIASAPSAGSNTSTYTLTCVKEGITASKQCQVQLGRPGIVLVTNPQHVRSGEAALIGWITAGMKSCLISSPDQSDFTQRNASNTSVNGAATTSSVTQTSRFQLDCQTLGGTSRQATTTVVLIQ